MRKLNTIAIDMGHNVNYDTGAVGIKSEDELNKLVGEALISKLREVGINVVNCTPDNANSLYDSLNQRCEAANNADADFFISIHHNSGGGEGAEVLCLTRGLAEDVGNAILHELSEIGFRNRGVKDRRDLFVINHTVMKAILVECAFCDSESDMSNYDSERIAQAILDGVCKSFDIKLSDAGEANENNEVIYHTVVSGECLNEIANRYRVSVDRLVEINGIVDKNFIFIGQRMRIK